MENIKKDFPILRKNSDLVYLDSSSTTQKPEMVLEGTKNYLESSYANIHRGNYDLSEESERFYEDSKKKVASFLGVSNRREIIYTYNSTYALNLLCHSFRRTGLLKKGDKVLLSIVEHHSNVVPWLILKEDLGIEIDYIRVKDDCSLDLDDLKNKLDKKVKILSISHISNVTGQVFDLENVREILPNETIFIVDASQSFPHFKVDINKIKCDFLFFTGHKVMAEGGIGVLWGRETLLKELKPAFSGGGAISYVKEQEFKYNSTLPEKWEPGTPNLNGAMSLFYALEYIEKIGGYKKIKNIEDELVSYTLKKFKNYPNIKLIGSESSKNRVGVFSFIVKGIHSQDIAETLAEKGVCIRAGQHCAEPFMDFVGENDACRMSIYLYNTKDDIDKFFGALEKIIEILK